LKIATRKRFDVLETNVVTLINDRQSTVTSVRFCWFPSSSLGTQSWKLLLPVYSHLSGMQSSKTATACSHFLTVTVNHWLPLFFGFNSPSAYLAKLELRLLNSQAGAWELAERVLRGYGKTG